MASSTSTLAICGFAVPSHRCFWVLVQLVLLSSLAAVARASNTTPSPSYSFVSIGDWGGNLIPGHSETVSEVLAQLSSTIKATDSQLIINAGDSFYYCGLKGKTDPQIESDYVKPFDGIDLPMYGVLGNHAYGYKGSPETILGLADKYPNWIMDGHTYSRRVEIAPDQYISFVMIDTNVCINDYLSSDNTKWDPCGSRYPTCNLSNDDDDEPTCYFHEEIMAAPTCASQLEQYSSILEAIPQDDWIIIVGHHAADEIDAADYLTPMFDRGFDLYINGHTHSLAHYAIRSTEKFITTGAGSMAPLDALSASTPSLRGRPALGSKVESATSSRERYTTIFNQGVAGFTQHTISGDELQTRYITNTGRVIHQFTVTKSSRQ